MLNKLKKAKIYKLQISTKPTHKNMITSKSLHKDDNINVI